MTLSGGTLLAQVGMGFSLGPGSVVKILAAVLFLLCIFASSLAPLFAIFHAVDFVVFRKAEPVRLANCALWASLPLAIAAVLIAVGWSWASDHGKHFELTVLAYALLVNVAAIAWLTFSARYARP